MKNLTIVLALTIVFTCGLLAACSAPKKLPGEGDSAEPTQEPTVLQMLDEDTGEAIPLEATEAYKAVLNGDADYIETGGKCRNLYQLMQSGFTPEDSVGITLKSFTKIDLDDDGVQEVVLQCARIDVPLSIILRYYEGDVYGYVRQLRQLEDLKADGTFYFSSGAFDHGIGKVTFEEKEYSTDEITYCKSHYDAPDDGEFMQIDFFVSKEPVTGDKFETAIQQQEEKPKPQWYDYNSENIDLLF